MAARRERDPFGEGLFGEWLRPPAERLGRERWQPAADVYETEKAIVVRLELAGAAGREPRVDADAQRVHQMEIAFGPFERALRIGIPFDRDQVSAQIEDGFLRVTLPKKPAGPRRIDVENES